MEKSDFVHVSSNTTFYNIDSINSYYNTNTYHKCLGTGNNYGLLIGYKFSNSIISAEVDFRYFSSNVLTFTSQDYYDFPEEPDFHVEYNYTDNLKSTSFSIAPTLKLTLNYNKWGFFLKSGLLIAKSSVDYKTDTRIFNTHPNYYPFESYTETIKYKPRWEIGIKGTLGMEYQLASWVVLNLGIQHYVHGYKPESASVTEYKYRGENQLDDLTISEREFVFSDSFISYDNDSEDKPTVTNARTYTFSSIAIQLGIQFIIHNKGN